LPSPSKPSIVGFALPAALVLFVVHAALLTGFWSDDAFITYRYAKHIALGLGAVFNPGERVEGYSNPLFTLLLAGIHRLVPDVMLFPLVARGVGMVSAALALVALAACPGTGVRAGIALGLLLTASSTSFALWSVGGLETSLYCLLIVAGFVLTLRRPRGAPSEVGLGLLLAAIALSRPEGVIPAAALFAGRFLDSETRGDWRGHATVAIAAAVPVAAYVGFRVAYFGNPLPNTYYAKRYPPDVAFLRGVSYLQTFFQRNGDLALYLPAVFAFRAAASRRIARLGSLLLALYLPFNLLVGGDWMDGHRFIAPLTPILYALVGLGWIGLSEWARDALGSRGGLTLARLAVPAGAATAWLMLAVPSIHLTHAERERPGMSVIPYFTVMSRVIGAATPPGWTIAAHDIGAVGWYGGTRVLDLLGLVDGEVARTLHGHDGARLVDLSVARRRPELVLLHYDNRRPPRVRWLPLDVPHFDSLYVLPRGLEYLPRSLRVRADVAAEFDRRLARIPESLRREVRALHEHLRKHQPDMRSVLVADPP